MTGGSSPNTRASSGAAKRPTIPGITCRRQRARGALRNGAPFKDWVLPASLDKIRRKLTGANDGDRQMVKILAAVLTDGLPAVEAACGQALAEGVHSADVILNILARRRQPPAPAPIATPASLALRQPPIANCARYDSLIGRSEERPSLTSYGSP
jgi:hypothetical protein